MCVDELTLTTGKSLPCIHACWEPGREEGSEVGRSGIWAQYVIRQGTYLAIDVIRRGNKITEDMPALVHRPAFFDA